MLNVVTGHSQFYSQVQQKCFVCLLCAELSCAPLIYVSEQVDTGLVLMETHCSFHTL
jgi:hypothetical protein